MVPLMPGHLSLFLGTETPIFREMMTPGGVGGGGGFVAGFPGGSDGEESVRNAGDPGSIPGLGRYPGGGNDSPLQ